jgi:hypothetical protein
MLVTALLIVTAAREGKPVHCTVYNLELNFTFEHVCQLLWTANKASNIIDKSKPAIERVWTSRRIDCGRNACNLHRSHASEHQHAVQVQSHHNPPAGHKNRTLHLQNRRRDGREGAGGAMADNCHIHERRVAAAPAPRPTACLQLSSHGCQVSQRQLRGLAQVRCDAVS